MTTATEQLSTASNTEVEFSVPVVDISAYIGAGDDQAARRETAAALDRACRELGFIQIVGHGVPASATARLAAAIDDFFALPMEHKQAYQSPPSVNRGYTPPASESLSLSLGLQSASRMNDFFEAFNVGAGAADYPHVKLSESDYAPNLWPDSLPRFESAVSDYFAHAQRVARTLTRIFADALALPGDFFERFTDHSLDVLRMNNYALPAGSIRLDTELTGMGEHTDYGIVTVLWADDVPGLQVLSPSGHWHDVSPAPGALLVNLGDLTARWTNERWLSTLHRVKPPVVDGQIRRRRSAAFFHDGNIDAVISAIPSCIPDGDVATYLPITVGEHIHAKLAGSRAGKANTTAVRDAARVLAAD